jgi:hypothetical protein
MTIHIVLCEDQYNHELTVLARYGEPDSGQVLQVPLQNMTNQQLQHVYAQLFELKRAGGYYVLEELVYRNMLLRVVQQRILQFGCRWRSVDYYRHAQRANALTRQLLQRYPAHQLRTQRALRAVCQPVFPLDFYERKAIGETP